MAKPRPPTQAPDGTPLSDVSDTELSALVDDVLKSGKHLTLPPKSGTEKPEKTERLHARVIAQQLQRLAVQIGETPEVETGPGPAEADEWWFETAGGRIGPINLKKIRYLWEEGELTPDSLCWREGFTSWVSLFKISELAQALAPKPPEPEKTREVTAEIARKEPSGKWKPKAGPVLERTAKEQLETSQKKALGHEAPIEAHSPTAGSFQPVPVVTVPVPEVAPRKTGISGPVLSGLISGLVVAGALLIGRYLPSATPAPAPTPAPGVVVPAAPAAPAPAPIAAAPAATALPPPAARPALPKVIAKPAPKKPTVDDSFTDEFKPAQEGPPKELGQADIMGVVVNHKAEVMKCVAAQHADNPEGHGRLVMRWTVHPNGRVSDISPRTDELADSPLAECLSKEIAAWKFPEHQTQGDPVDFPFSF